MAGGADVEDVMLSGMSVAVYPDGTGAASAAGVPVRLYRGWPDAKSVEDDCRAGTAHVSIFPRTTRVIGRELTGWQPIAAATPPMTAAVAGNMVTLAGTGAAGQIVAVLEGGKSWTVEAAGTPAQAAAALAAAISADRPATASGAVLTLSAAVGLQARVGVPRAEQIALRRQVQQYQVVVWAPTPDARDALVDVLDLWAGRTQRLALSDGQNARMTWGGNQVSDDARQVPIYRSDLMLMVDYATVDSRETMTTVAGQTVVTCKPPADADAATITLTLNT